MDFSEKSRISHEIERLLENEKFTKKQKQSLYGVILKLNERDLSKDRFCKVYGLGSYDKKTLEEVADEYNVRISSIQGTIRKIISDLCYISDDDSEILKNIILEYRKSVGLPETRFTSQEKYYIVEDLLGFAKSKVLNNIQKQQAYNVLVDLKDLTDTQLERFMLFYNLKDDDKQYRYCDLARLHHCSPSAISSSIHRVAAKLRRTKEENILIIKNIINECKKNDEI